MWVETHHVPMPPEPEVSECPECGAGVKLGLDGSRDLAGTELTESDVRGGEYFLCPVCQVAWDVDKQTPYDVPVTSAGPGGGLSEATAGRSVSNGETSNYRLLGYGEEGELILRDVGELAFARDDSPGPTDPRKLERQLGEVLAVEASGIRLRSRASRTGSVLPTVSTESSGRRTATG